MRSRSATLALLLLVAATTGCGGRPQVALDPLPLQDDDRYDIPEPAEFERDDYYDQLDFTVYKPVEQLFDMPRNFRKLAGKPKQALEVTPLDEIQDSSWFTNRMSRRKLTAAEVRQGPLQRPGPDLEHRWSIVAGKTQGVTPGFTIEDARGDRYVIKFDPLSDPELATGAEAIGTRIFWALGYNVPENYLVYFRPESLQIAPKATLRLPLGRRRPFTTYDLRIVLDKVPKRPDGSIRAIASRYLAGKPIGPIHFMGVRADDPNDVIRHEHRRGLRAYKAFCSWVNHNDSREINTLDVYTEEDGRHFVKHYLIDFGAILGSASTGKNLRSEGFEYQFDFGEMGKSLASLGLYTRPWTRLEFPDIPGVGNFEAERFDPGEWKANYPFPPFENMTPRDGFWAAKIVMRFDDDLLRAVVEEAQYSDPRATDYIVQALALRRDRIGGYWFSRVSALDEFRVVQAPSATEVATPTGTSGGAAKPGGPAGAPELHFTDLAVHYGFLPARGYRISMRGPDDRALAAFESEAAAIGLGDVVRELGTPAPGALDERLVEIRIEPLATESRWRLATTVTLYLEPSGTLRIAAIERDES